MSTEESRPPGDVGDVHSVGRVGGHGGEAGRLDLIAQTTAEVRQQQIAYDRFHDAVAAYLGINRTDLRCLDILDLSGQQTAGELAVQMGMSTGAVTAMLDRLEKAGYLRRVRDPADRRRVLVETAELARERGREIYQPFEELTVPMFARFTDEQLAVVRDFLRLGNDFYDVQTTRIEDLARRSGR
jgi:DNA-binding MarR family transcriptional regulator